MKAMTIEEVIARSCWVQVEMTFQTQLAMLEGQWLAYQQAQWVAEMQRQRQEREFELQLRQP